MNKSRPKVRLSRALGIPLTPKSVPYFEKRPYPPGDHGRRRRQQSDYSLRLREKQRLRYQYDIGEKQLRRVFDEAVKKPGKTGEVFVSLLERRLDATVLRAGFAKTIYQARQFVTHRHITVNGLRVDRPSYRLEPGDVVAVHERSRQLTPFVVAASGANAGAGPSAPYLDVSMSSLTARVLRDPERSEVPVICNEQLVVEFYSR
ncbi:30S ribosomal protein S4 [Cryptosporangium phraense]|uniref:Small ribosomal subunit protein uS4 n=1 Tax=Cryptosporangium phraense TaxID=2593070 RepID=A0A545APJ9_9ACTN|nr:30S ribosomal protein S4 [Cryptosporangium phraense]TQS43248.1 30S ribosomal protein S4 [Cryptosporangium phraense]